MWPEGLMWAAAARDAPAAHFFRPDGLMPDALELPLTPSKPIAVTSVIGGLHVDDRRAA
jgi:hypothetical protein